MSNGCWVDYKGVGIGRSPVYTLKEFSTGVDVPYSTLYHWMKKTDEPPEVRLRSRGRTYYSLDDLNAWLESYKSAHQVAK